MSAPRFDADADNYTRTANVVSANFSVCFWCRPVVDKNALTYLLSIDANNGAFSNYVVIRTASDGTNLTVFWVNSSGVSGNSANILNMTVNNWFFAAMTRSGNTLTGYARTVTGSLSSQSTTISGTVNPTAAFRIGASTESNLFFNGRIGAVKYWDAALTLSELSQESQQYVPYRFGNINGFWPLMQAADDEKDFGPNGRDLNVGTATFEEGPPIPWKRTRVRIPQPLLPPPPPVPVYGTPFEFDRDFLPRGLW